jgi:tRNA(fMet)-specific endonuclease VapC
MSFLLHRDICIAWVRSVPLVVSRFQHHRGLLHVSAINVKEVEVWLLGPSARARHLQGFGAMMQAVNTVPVDEAVAHRAALLVSTVRTGRARMTMANALVAATALVHGFTLVTHTTQAFTNVSGLGVADWMVP